MLKNRGTINLETDTLIVKASYRLGGFLGYENKEYKPVGEISIIKWSPDEIVVKENFSVTDTAYKRTFKYVGERTFQTRFSN